MKFKPVPEPPAEIAFLDDARQSVPLTPSPENDCCSRLVGRTDVATIDDARTWLTFLRALTLVEETEFGYARTRRDVDADDLAAAFRKRVFGADRVLETLAAADRPLSTAEVFERVRDVVPNWERLRHDDWEGVWTERVGFLLDWAVLFDLVDRTDEGYV